MGLLEDLHASRRAAGSGREVPAGADDDGLQPALLFIPDISGFTRFIEASDSPLAPFLIADLLEILIEANTLDMQVSEIQGDAILFYRLGPPPPVQELVEQCRRIFLDFQNYLRLVERDNASALGAALRAHDLTLKIVVHYGRVNVAQIREFTKLMGRDVIVVHRLLKNNISGGEYLLLSEGYLKTQTLTDLKRSFSWTRLLGGKTTYEYLGDINYRYAHLTPLRLLLNGHHAPDGMPSGRGNSLKVRHTVRVPAAYALRLVRNLRLRYRWLEGGTAVHYDLSKSDRLGTSYKVDVNQGQIDFQTVQSFQGEERIEYVEKISHFRLFPNSLLFFFIEAVDEQSCLITLDFRYGYVASPHPLIRFGQLRRVHRFWGRSLRSLVALGERMAKV
ncbi:hypothetical protein SAMN00120144_1895 [Hymenobacter roseosalivarius DSM 11622]|uniref:DUF2652 domain-containing protein n=1 Tax=Hymenobacter roseosalivarius DSM 11622 TaxID=645990 RepID=A0A1W1VPF4_9BACT|nr:DUF2652 domain-containing protein [Hymenobacter roseosalivarius]SMB95237.1 hypothetical protein SAMN00120144_1895 [Hymenobacter roseosalivarius DSM 11622]